MQVLETKEGGSRERRRQGSAWHANEEPKGTKSVSFFRLRGFGMARKPVYVCLCPRW